MSTLTEVVYGHLPGLLTMLAVLRRGGAGIHDIECEAVDKVGVRLMRQGGKVMRPARDVGFDAWICSG